MQSYKGSFYYFLILSLLLHGGVCLLGTCKLDHHLQFHQPLIFNPNPPNFVVSAFPLDLKDPLPSSIHSANFVKKSSIKGFMQNQKKSSQKLIATKHQQSLKSMPVQFKREGYDEFVKLLHERIFTQQGFTEENAGAGVITVGFYLGPDGEVHLLSLLKPSNNQLANQAALNLVASIFPIKEASHYLHQQQFFQVDIIFD